MQIQCVKLSGLISMVMVCPLILAAVTFVDQTDALGQGTLRRSYDVAAWADIDNDGDLDLTTDGKFFVNQGNGNNWLRVKLEGNGITVNRSAIGAQVRIDMGAGVIQSRQVEGGTGKGNQNEMILHFGMGSRSLPVDLEILWPGGETQNITDVSLNQICSVTQPQHMTISTVLLTPVATRGENAAFISSGLLSCEGSGRGLSIR